MKNLERVLSINFKLCWKEGGIRKVCWDILEIKFISFENEISLRKSISFVIGGITKGKVISWSKISVVRPFSEISLIEYNKVIKGFPNITLLVIFFTKTKVVLIQTPSLQTWAFGSLNSIFRPEPLACESFFVVFS